MLTKARQYPIHLVRIETDFHTVNVAILAVCVWGAFGVAPGLFSSDACTGFKGEGYPIVALWIENGGEVKKKTAITFSLPNKCLITNKRLPMKKKKSLDFWIHINKQLRVHNFKI